jgi:DNA-binding CsgD family transcriptional regulator
VTRPDPYPEPPFPRLRAREGWGRQPIRVVLHIADHDLRADIADICEGADIVVVAPPLPSPALTREPEREGWGEDADVALTDRPVETAIPTIALVSGEARRVWPTSVHAIVPADVDAATLVAIITVVAAGYALTPLPRPPLAPILASRAWGAGESKGAGAGEDDPHPTFSRLRGRVGWGDPGDPVDGLTATLSPREHEVLALLAEGASNKEIARALGLTIHTIKFHVASLTEKLGARSRVEAVAIAIRAGLVMV